MRDRTVKRKERDLEMLFEEYEKDPDDPIAKAVAGLLNEVELKKEVQKQARRLLSCRCS